MSAPRRALVVTVSDSTHQGTRTDQSGPAVAERLRDAGFEVTGITVVPDERTVIAQLLRDAAHSHSADAVFTTGGTGVAARDVTPEAIRDVIDREIPGFGEEMRRAGRDHTHLASLSRGLAGVCGRLLIVTLPGSPKGAVQSLNAILELVPHVLDLLGGNTSHEQ